ncbi:uncharacterized protein At2g34160-like [Primulina tabacum]|uniref:uncharacterized protein At2g34160-like n=1 Tax=Primulina tabacum TaxID=48773 RepID=UPI003F5A1FE0
MIMIKTLAFPKLAAKFNQEECDYIHLRTIERNLAEHTRRESSIIIHCHMEGITEGVNKMKIADFQKKNRIQVSNTKKPLFFYVNLTKRYLQQHDEVELSALGMAISTVVSIAEILKNNGFVTEKKIMTSTVEIKDDGSRGRPIQKAKIEIVLGKTANFDELMAAAVRDGGENGNGED